MALVVYLAADPISRDLLNPALYTNALEEMRAFLDTRPNEVIVIVFEDLITPADTEQAFQESGLDELNGVRDES